MSSPTFGSDQPGPDQSYPQGGASQGQPWGAPPPPPPAQGYGAPAPGWSGSPVGYGAGQRPGQVTAAAVIGIVIGALGVLGLFSLGVYFAFDAMLGLLAILSVASAAVLLVGGIQAIQGRSPRLLLLGSFASIAVQLLTLVWAVISGWGFLFFGLLGFILPGLIVFFLQQPRSRQYFAARGISY
ncbi:MAG TPA: hypothetical protein VGB58_06495 [Blastococcus sp.]|jgi:hypothetical protein